MTSPSSTARTTAYAGVTSPPRRPFNPLRLSPPPARLSTLPEPPPPALVAYFRDELASLRANVVVVLPEGSYLPLGGQPVQVTSGSNVTLIGEGTGAVLDGQRLSRLMRVAAGARVQNASAAPHSVICHRLSERLWGCNQSEL